ncbi:AMP-binding protein [Amycolatopsis japonica]|uniref:non-ribosomal peptide synthetase n=1 Tax=Amycolatopsis japonica TaxID=208439 RepID=UPI0037A807FE
MSQAIVRGAALGPAESVLSRFDAWVHENPRATAVEDAENAWSYADLDAEANRIAGALRNAVSPGTLVGVCVERSATLIALAVGLARLGAVYLPLGTRQGGQRLAELRDRLGGLPLIAAHDGPADELLPFEPILGHPLVIASGGDSPVVAPAGAYYAVLTSGSAGTPKVVAVGADSLARVIRWYTTVNGCGPGDRHSFTVSVPFDAHLLEMWAVLASGATLVNTPDSVAWDPQALIEWWRDRRISIANLPTPIGEEVLAKPWPEMPALRHLFIGGDRLRRWQRPEVTTRVHNIYGPAEATIATTSIPLEADGAGAPPIGLPVDGAILCVTDESGEILPREAVGELRIGGAGLAIGYLDGDLTAARYVAPPKELSELDRVYRSGDRVRMRADGVLEYLGRLDDQFKVSGARIEPTEVETAFERDHRVARAVAAVHDTAGGLRRLVVFVSLAPDAGDPSESDVLAAVRAWLPEHEVPAEVFYVETFPRTGNGKIDRSALVAGLRVCDVPAESTTLSTTERTVQRLCRTVLDIPNIGVGDHFVGHGGTSMLAVRLLDAVEKTFGVRLRAPEILSQPDLRRLAALIDERTRVAD